MICYFGHEYFSQIGDVFNDFGIRHAVFEKHLFQKFETAAFEVIKDVNAVAVSDLNQFHAFKFVKGLPNGGTVDIQCFREFSFRR